MAANLHPDLQKQNFDGERSGTTSRQVDNLTFPVIYQPGSQEAHSNEKDIKLYPPSAALLGMNLQNVGAGPSASTSGEVDHELVPPISEPRTSEEVRDFKGKASVTFLAPLAPEKFQGDSQRTHQSMGDTENTDDHHIMITIPEPDDQYICRTCGPEEEMTDDLLVELGCLCRGTLSRMHRQCILEWFGPRICLQNDYRCELCNARVHGRIELLVLHAMFSRGSSDNDILVKAMASRLPRRLGARRLLPPQNTAPNNVQMNIEVARQAGQRPQGHINHAPGYAPNRPQHHTNRNYEPPNRLHPQREPQLNITVDNAPNQMSRRRNMVVVFGVILGLIGLSIIFMNH